MTEDDLRAHIEQQEALSLGSDASITAAEQAKAMDYYLGRPFGNEEEGRSSVISSDVWDVVEGLTPLVLKPFVSTDDVVTFQPLGPDDEDAAQQESDYINYVVTQKNDVFETLVAWVKCGLLQKNGIVKYWWEDTRRVEIERYYDLSDDVYSILIADENVTPIEHSERTNERSETEHDVTLRIAHTEGQAKYCVVPPEEIRVGRDATSPDPKKSRFFQHRTKKTISALREMGYKVPDDIRDMGTGGADSMPQAVARATEMEQVTASDGYGDPSLREVWYRETFLLVDFDGDGIAELRKVCMVGDTVLANEETEEIPFCGWTPILQLFKYDGRCPADAGIEIQDVKTTLWRQGLDNIYTINNNRTFISDKVNIDDMLDNQIAGLVRIDGDEVGNHAMSMPVTPIGGVIQPMIEYLDSAKENRTGFTRANQGASDLGNQKTLGEIEIVSEAGRERVDIMARSFAEMGLKPLMLGVHGLCRRHGSKAETVRLRGKWVQIDPRGWRTRRDMSVSVGLGTSDKRMQIQAQQLIMAEQKQLAAVGIVTPQNFLAGASRMVELTGEKSPEKYFTDPAKNPPPPQPPPPELELQKAEQQIKQGELQIKGQQAQLDAKRLELETRKVDILDRDSMVKAETAEAEIALQAQAQGLNMQQQLMEAVVGIQQQLHQMQLATAQHQLQAQDQEHAQALAEAQHAQQAEAQQHSQALDVAQHEQQGQAQEHAQGMAEQQQTLAQQQAAQAARKPNGQA